MAISAVVAVGDAANPLIARLKQKALEIKVGPGSDASSDMGPVVSAQARDRIVGYFARGSAAGATIVVDGPDCTVDSSPDGFFVGPTLFDHVATKMDIYTDEILGPVLCVLRVDTLNEAHRANQCQSVRQRYRGLHEERKRSAHFSARHQGRHGRHQRSDTGADGVLFFRRLESIALRRPSYSRTGGRDVLHPREGRHQ
jgi:hypothetical protein